MKIGTAQILQEIDKACVERIGIPMLVLMENAALKVLKHLETSHYNSYVVVCGTGNNGGDGLALARHLLVMGKTVEVFLIHVSNNLSECTKVNYHILKNMGVKIKVISSIEDVHELRQATSKCDVVVDAIFGTGLNKNVEGVYDSVISIINENSRRIFSIDIPSGLQCDSGKVLGNCIKASKTICFVMYKRGFLNYDCSSFIGEVIVEDIGIPSDLIDEFHNKEYIIEAEQVKNLIKKRGKHEHKGNFGRASIIAGSKGFYGAACIATEAAVRSGSGLVTLISSEEVQIVASLRLLEAMTANYEESSFNRLIKNSDSIAFGPGMGNNEETLSILKRVLDQAACPIVIDADGINVLVSNLELLKAAGKRIVLTPHLGEMSRLTGLSIEHIKENRVDVAKTFAKEHGVVVLLKGYETVITDGESTFINPTGNSSMASGGMGDCLTGIIASFIGQGIEPIYAACCATYIHGSIGEKLSKEMYCVNASHIIEKLPFEIKEIID